MLTKNVFYYDDTHYVNYQPLNGKDLGLRTNFMNLKENFFDDKIVDLCTKDGEVILSKGDEVTIELPIPGEDPFKTVYPINSIHPNLEGKYNYIASVEENNKANKFILPSLGQNSAYFSCNTYMINSYITGDHKYLMVRYRFSISNDYTKLEKELSKHNLYQGFYDVDNFSVVFKFGIPKEFHKDIETFLEGRYSLMSDRLKNKIKIFYSSNSKPELLSNIIHVLERNEKLRKRYENKLGIKISEKSELESKPNKDQEIWTMELKKQEKPKKTTNKHEQI